MENHLWILSDGEQTIDSQQTNGDSNEIQPYRNLRVIGAYNNFGSNESIRATRFVKNMAYVVTFRQTDPVFAFDLSDPTSPSLLGELEVRGFSSYLHPVETDQLLGIGFGPDREVQISLFDVANPYNISRLDNKLLALGSSSEATHNHHALFYDSLESLVAIPYFEYGFQSFAPTSPSHLPSFRSGAIFFKLVGNQMTEIARVSHQRFSVNDCGYVWMHSDVRRVFRLDDRIITVSLQGLMSHDPADPSVVWERVAFPGEFVCNGL